MRFLILSLILGCNTKITDFISKHQDDNFKGFINKSFIIRSFNHDNSISVFVSLDYSNASKSGPYILEVDAKNNRIIREKTEFLSDSMLSALNKEEITKLLDRFLTYKVRRLTVDLDSNLFISLSDPEYIDILKACGHCSIPNVDQWEHITGHWYLNNN